MRVTGTGGGQQLLGGVIGTGRGVISTGSEGHRYCEG